MRHLMTALVAIFVSVPAWAEKDYVDTAKRFAECSGLWQAYAEFVSDMNPHTAEAVSNIGNGSAIAAQYFAFLANDDWLKAGDWAENVTSAAAAQWRAILFGMAMTEEELKVETDACAALKEVQAAVLDELRRQSAGFN